MAGSFSKEDKREQTPRNIDDDAIRSALKPKYQAGDRVGFRCLRPEDISRPYCAGVIQTIKNITWESYTYVVLLEETNESVEIPKLYADVLLRPLHQIPQDMMADHKNCPRSGPVRG